MLIDHIGFFLLPDVLWFRYIGRLSMPLFAFFIAEGCRHTSHKLRYFLRVFLLGLGCQIVYSTQQLMAGSGYFLEFNILLTFSFSLIVGFAYLSWEKAVESGDIRKIRLRAVLFLAAFLSAVVVCVLFREAPIYIRFEYALPGIMLPLAALISKDRNRQFLYFSAALLLFCAASYRQTPFVWYALFDIPLLALYNGKKGKLRLKYAFYLFYPAHMGLLYLIDIIF